MRALPHDAAPATPTPPASAASRRPARRARALPAGARPAALLSPMLVYMVLFFLTPILVMFVYSFWQVDGWILIREFTLKNYLEVAGNAVYRKLALRSLEVGLSSAVVSIVIAYPLSYTIAVKAGKHKDFLLFLVLLTLFSNYLIRIYAFRSILSANGLADTLAVLLGLSAEHRSYLLYSPAGVVIALANVYVPVAVLPIYSALLNIPEHLREAARDLGAGPLRTFYEVTLPLSAPGVVAAFVFIFLLSSGDFVTPELVGGTDGAMIGGSIVNQFGTVFNWPRGSAQAFALLLVMAGLLVGLAYLARALGLLRRSDGR
jgi:spermidine/putrescine transport system permease protein